MSIPQMSLLEEIIWNLYHICKDRSHLSTMTLNFLCHQKWVAWLPMLLFTFGDKDKNVLSWWAMEPIFIKKESCCQTQAVFKSLYYDCISL